MWGWERPHGQGLWIGQKTGSPTNRVRAESENFAEVGVKPREPGPRSLGLAVELSFLRAVPGHGRVLMVGLLPQADRTESWTFLGAWLQVSRSHGRELRTERGARAVTAVSPGPEGSPA